MRESPLIHIGYHKTGTTWLQKFLFSNESAGFGLAFPVAEVSRLIGRPNPLVFDTETTRSLLLEGIDSVLTGDLYPVLSAERLSGNPHSGGYDSAALAERLHDLLPKGKVLIVIRKQADAVLSSYKEYLLKGGRGSVSEYVRPPRDGRIPLFDLEHFSYHLLVALYLDLFGRTNVLVLPYEHFQRDGRGFVSAICEFAGVKASEDLPYDRRVNTAMSALVAAVRRRVNVVNGRRRGTSINPDAMLVPAAGQLIARIGIVDRFVP
ncbi:MAG: sulfotransferase domain-containing protein, partial [Acidimicrobiia bacterium]